MRRAATALICSEGLVPLRTGASFSTSVAVHDTLALSQANTGGGFLSKLFGGGSRLSIPLTDALDTVEIPSIAPPVTKPETKVTQLPNGVRIASEAVVVWDGLACPNLISLCVHMVMLFHRVQPSVWVCMWMQAVCMRHP